MLKIINQILQINDDYQAPDRIMEVIKMPLEERNKIFMQFLELWNYDVDYDNLRQYFEEAHAKRSTDKQDFTPESIAKLVARITRNGFKRMDVCSGTGSLTIAQWTEDRINDGIWKYSPGNYLYQCYELSDRTVPFLLLNLMIRGINAIVFHGDVLTREWKAVYLTINEENDYLGFSGLMEMTPKDAKEVYKKTEKMEFYENPQNPKKSKKKTKIILDQPTLFDI